MLEGGGVVVLELVLEEVPLEVGPVVVLEVGPGQPWGRARL